MRVVHVRDRVPGAVYIGRPSIFGNPFPLSDEADRTRVINQYKTYFRLRMQDPEFAAAVEGLRGKDLACYCAPKPCHGDVIIDYLSGT